MAFIYLEFCLLDAGATAAFAASVICQESGREVLKVEMLHKTPEFRKILMGGALQPPGKLRLFPKPTSLRSSRAGPNLTNLRLPQHLKCQHQPLHNPKEIQRQGYSEVSNGAPSPVFLQDIQENQLAKGGRAPGENGHGSYPGQCMRRARNEGQKGPRPLYYT